MSKEFFHNDIDGQAQSPEKTSSTNEPHIEDKSAWMDSVITPFKEAGLEEDQRAQPAIREIKDMVSKASIVTFLPIMIKRRASSAIEDINGSE